MDKKIIAMLVIGLLALVGCQQSGGDTISLTSKPFIGGTNSIGFEFIEGSPPKEVYDGGSFGFEVTLNVENLGEYDVAATDLEMDLVGFYPADFSRTSAQVTEKNPSVALEKSYIDSEGNVIPGTQEYMTFDGFNFVSPLSANNEYTIRAEACYLYGTRAQADICILQDLTKTMDKVCEVNEKKTVYSSAAPIQIENFQQSIAGTEKITFSFEIVHRGSGLVSNKDAIDRDTNRKCSDDTDDKNDVWVNVDYGSGATAIGSEALSCSGFTGVGSTATSGFVTLYGGKRLIRCTQPTTSLTGDFEKKLFITANYRYKEHKEMGIMVKHLTP